MGHGRRGSALPLGRATPGSAAPASISLGLLSFGLLSFGLVACDAPFIGGARPAPGPDGAIPKGDDPRDATVGDAVGDATPPDAGPPLHEWPEITGPLTWTVLQTLVDALGIRCEKVAYESEGHTLYGQVCRPSADGTYPLIAFNHGGFQGLGDLWGANEPVALAAKGYVVVASSYRGEDDSGGAIETCKGEAVDVIRMVRIAKAQPYVDPTRVGMVGMSHGGCITMMVLARGEPLDAAVNMVGPSNWATTFTYLVEELSAPDVDPGTAFFAGSLQAHLLDQFGGPPGTALAAYQASSPITYLANLAASDVPLLIVHGTEDVLIPARDQCKTAALMGNFATWYVGGDGMAIVTAPDACKLQDLDWLAGTPPWAAGSFTAQRTLVMHANAGHHVRNDADNSRDQWLRAVAFLDQHLVP